MFGMNPKDVYDTFMFFRKLNFFYVFAPNHNLTRKIVGIIAGRYSCIFFLSIIRTIRSIRIIDKDNHTGHLEALDLHRVG